MSFSEWPLRWLGVLLIPAALCADISDVRVAGVSSTQAILSYTAPDSNPCTLQVSESQSYAPAIHDVDPQLFAGSDSDARPGSVSIGQSRLVVIGKRIADIAADGKRYSRALQAYTPHYFRIACGGDVAEGSFLTGNIPLGKTYGEVPPVDPEHPGFYAWPRMAWDDPDPRVIDPQTGILVKPISRPQKLQMRYSKVNFGAVRDLGGQQEWANLPLALSDPAGAAVTYNGANRSWLFLRTAAFALYQGTNWVDDGNSLDYFQLRLKAWGAATDPEERALQMCLTIDGTNCASVVRTVDIPSSEPAVAAVIGTATPYLDFWNDATHVVTRPDTVRRRGAVSVDAAGNVAYISGDLFSPNWTGGSTITIGSSECRIAQMVHARALAIDAASCAPSLALPVDKANYTADNFGVLIRKQSPGADPVFIKAASFDYGSSQEPPWAYGGHTLYCANKLLPDGSDPPQYGFHCDLYGVLYWINPATGEARLLGDRRSYRGTLEGDTLSGCNTDAATFNADNPNIFYCASAASGKTVILQAEYTGSNQDAGQAPAAFPIPANWTNLTPASQGLDLGAQIRQFDPEFDPGLFGCGIRGQTGDGKLAITCMRGGQDTIGWGAIFDPAARKIVAAYNYWEKSPARWCKIHSAVPVINSDAWMAFTPSYYLTGANLPGGGPWETRVTSPDVTASTFEECPANEFGAAGPRCLTVSIAGEPCDLGPAAGEPLNCSWSPNATYLMPAREGDIFLYGTGEYVRLLARNGNQWVLQRAYGMSKPGAHPAGEKLSAVCAAQNFNISSTNLTFWNFKQDPAGTNSASNSVVIDLAGTSHVAITRELIAGNADWRDCSGQVYCLSVRTGTDVADWVAKPPFQTPMSAPKFAGLTGVADDNFIQAYPAFGPTAAGTANRDWLLFTRPVTSSRGLNKLTPIGGQLYKVAGAPLHRAQLATMAVCGLHPLVDVSAPDAVLDDGPAGAFRYCVARRDGECQDSARTRNTAAGDVFVNCPNVGVPMDASCTGSEDDRGICIADDGAYVNGMAQIGASIRGDAGAGGRVLTSFFHPYRVGNSYWNARTLPDGSWAMAPTPWLNLGRKEALLAKLPPFPEPDGVDRSDFVPVPLYLEAVDGAASAVVEFGYAENGDPGAFYCTSRRETCVKGAQKGNAYDFASDAPAGVECASGCTITVPGISQRVLYYRSRYLDASGQTISTTAASAVVVP